MRARYGAATIERLSRPTPLLFLPIVLAILAYAPGLATGFVSDDYDWLLRGARGELGWNASFSLTQHWNALPFEIALQHLKFTLFGFNATAYHLFTVAAHIGNVLLVYVLAGRIGFNKPIAYIAAIFAAVLAAGAQAIYWMAADPHVWATLGTLGAVILYIDHRQKGGWGRYAAAVLLAAAAPLVKAEGVGVIGGVLAYELIWRRPPQLTWKILPVALTPILFVVWEWNAQDPLQTHHGFGLNILVTGLGYLKQILLPIDPNVFFATTGGRLHLTLVAIGVTLCLEAAALAVLVIVGLVNRQSYGLGLSAVVGTAPALVVTVGIQARYVYFAGLLVALVAAVGAWRLFEFSRDHFISSRHALIGVVACAAFVVVQLQMTSQESSDLRAAHNESQAFLAAVLRDHPSVPDGTPICMLNTPLDVSSANAVFADPRLGPNVGMPIVTECGSAGDIPPGGWAYERMPDGTYTQVS